MQKARYSIIILKISDINKVIISESINYYNKNSPHYNGRNIRNMRILLAILDGDGKT
jgi:hypothetical protein